jgi:predicted nucleotide-binding protein
MPKKFNVAIVHGHSKLKSTVKKYVEELGFVPRILKDEYSAETIFARFRDLIWDHTHCVIIILTGDDIISKNRFRARQNVIFELGYCFGAFDEIEDTSVYKAEKAIIILEEDGIELFSDIDGLTTIKFSKGNLSMQKERIKQALQNSFASAKVYYHLD